MPTTFPVAVVELDRRAVRASLDALAGWNPRAGDPPTPCSGWTLGDLVAHMTVQQHGFARAFDGERTSLTDWNPVRHPDPVGAYRASCEVVLAALDRLTDPDAPVLLPEVRDEPLPAATVVGFHLVDNAVHAWDAARALGTDVRFDDDLAAAALAVARAVPDGDRRGREGSSFAHRRTVPPGTDPWSEALLLLGREPAWPARR